MPQNSVLMKNQSECDPTGTNKASVIDVYNQCHDHIWKLG